MSPITFLFLIILAVISPIFSSPIQPRKWGHEIDSGVLTSDYIDGFVGERPITGPDGDYLRTHVCYCKSEMYWESNFTDDTNDPTIPPLEKRLKTSDGNRDGQHSGGGGGIQKGEIVQGHFWRWEYFNYHYNATYFMTHYCMEDALPRDHYGCGADAPGKFNPSPASYFNAAPQNDISFQVSPLPGHAQHSWMILKKEMDIDWMMFGRGDWGHMQKRRLGKDQGLIQMPKEYVDDKCTYYCDTEMLLPMDHTMFNHAEIYNDIDDMCDRCA